MATHSTIDRMLEGPPCDSCASPEGEGLLDQTLVFQRTARHTPIGVRNIQASWFGTPPCPVHLRSRGEHMLASISSRPTKVHPRLRGSHKVVDTDRFVKLGSSPPARGPHQTSRRLGRKARLIPAHAGNTRSLACIWPMPPAHLCVSGEQVAGRGSSITTRGSSPRARGTLPIALSAVQLLRLIPTHAGNTRPSADPVPASSVHPAPAETTPSTSRSPSRSAVHPRPRGEHLSKIGPTAPALQPKVVGGRDPQQP